LSKNKKLRMWIYFTLLVIALMIVVIAVHFSREREINPKPGSGTQSITSSGSVESNNYQAYKTATITFYMLTLKNGEDLSLATVTLTASLPDTSTEALIKVALEYLANPPVKIDGMYPVLPSGTKVKKVEIKDGVVYIDFSKEILFPKYPSATSESLALCAIAGIPAQFGIDSTYITVEGKSSGPIDGKYVEDFWGHVGLSDQPLHPCK